MQLKDSLRTGETMPFIGVYDVFSASIASRYFDGIFLSGYGFAASYYGLPDIGFISWSDMVQHAQRVKTILPDKHIIVDIDDGYCDNEVAAHVALLLDSMGISGFVMEDQMRPRRCGHFEGKQLMDLDGFLVKLEKVRSVTRNAALIARTDASDPKEIARRVEAFSELEPDAILVDGLKDLTMIREIRRHTDRPIVFNQILGGKSPIYNLAEINNAGVSIVLYSTPCLFAAQAAVENAVRSIKELNGLIRKEAVPSVDLKTCSSFLQENLSARDRVFV